MDQSEQHLAGGLALAAAYVFVAASEGSRLGSLWGTVTPCLKRSYCMSITLAVAGYALVVWSLRGQGGYLQGGLFGAFAAVSALWMPLAFWAAREPDGPGAVLVVLQLALAALLAFAWALSMAPMGTTALAGAFLLAGNSIWLDLLVWPCGFLTPP